MLSFVSKAEVYGNIRPSLTVLDKQWREARMAVHLVVHSDQMWSDHSWIQLLSLVQGVPSGRRLWLG